MAKYEKIKHPDYKWIQSKTGTHGAAYTLPYYKINDCACQFDYIYGKSELYLFYLNAILYFRWLKRRSKQWFVKNIIIWRKL